MRIINRERGSGKTTILIGAAAATGARIITPTEDMARFVASEARKNGLDILEPFSIVHWNNVKHLHPFCGNDVLIDEGEAIIEEALKRYMGANVIAVTMTVPCNGVKKAVEPNERKR